MFPFNFGIVLSRDISIDTQKKQDDEVPIKPMLKGGSEKMLRIFIMKDSAMIPSTAVYIAITVDQIRLQVIPLAIGRY